MNKVGLLQKALYSILFLRKNALFVLDSGGFQTKNYVDIIPIAQAIDSMLVYGSPYVTLENTLSPPVVTSIQLSKSELKLNEMAVMTVNAYDPRGKKLEYERTPGVLKSADDPLNVFRIRASHDNWPEPFYGTRIIEAWVVNEDNFVSRKVTTHITFLTPSAVNDEDRSAEVPQVFTLFQNSPNPFNAATVIRFALPRAVRAELAVFDVTGRKVRSLVSGQLPAGTREVRWDGRDDSGRTVSSGVYLSRLRAGNLTATGRMLFLR